MLNLGSREVDVLILGDGPAALCLAAELVERRINVGLIAPSAAEEPWLNTYGIWAFELESCNITHLLSHRWKNTVSYFGNGQTTEESFPHYHRLDYGLFDREALRLWLLERCKGMQCCRGVASSVVVCGDYTLVSIQSGKQFRARVVVDATGHQTSFIRRHPSSNITAQQAAYGIVGRFNRPPVDPDQFVLMDFRPNHLDDSSRASPPTFLYAMDMGDGIFFVEETSLALAPPLPEAELSQRLQTRLSQRGVSVNQILHREHCLFPMNLPLPDLHQPLLAFGSAASMVHPASGYMIGGLLRRAPAVATAVASALEQQPILGSAVLARRGWQALWPREMVWRHRLFQFGLERLMAFDEKRLRQFFQSFFSLPTSEWSGFLANTLSLHQLIMVMLHLFMLAPTSVRRGLVLGLPSDQNQRQRQSAGRNPEKPTP